MTVDELKLKLKFMSQRNLFFPHSLAFFFFFLFLFSVCGCTPPSPLSFSTQSECPSSRAPCDRCRDTQRSTRAQHCGQTHANSDGRRQTEQRERRRDEQTSGRTIDRCDVMSPPLLTRCGCVLCCVVCVVPMPPRSASRAAPRSTCDSCTPPRPSWPSPSTWCEQQPQTGRAAVGKSGRESSC